MGERTGPSIYVIDFPRGASREAWKRHYRALRVSLRESEKMALDVRLFGTGAMFLDDDGDPRHVPLSDIFV